MLGAILRLFVAVMVLAGLIYLFLASLVVALIITPVLALLFYFFGRKQMAGVWVVRRGGAYQQRPGQGPVIDHDPSDLPPPDKAP
ncbi:MAG: hypothetical protein K2P94_05020 [Rhodospirillaceae bacterium]|nr:hypothetical protein [Rhodospirillaceae bacterium]